MQFKVPQNIEREDQIIGPVTMKQLIICVIGGGLAYSIYAFLAKRYTMEVWLPPTAFVGLLTLAIAFLRVNDIPFTKWILLLVEFFLTANRRVWTKGSDRITLIELPKKLFAQESKAKQPKTYNAKEVRRLVDALEKADYSHLADSQMKEIEAEKKESEHAERLTKISVQPPKTQTEKPKPEIKKPAPVAQKPESKPTPAPQKPVQKPAQTTPAPAKKKAPMKVIISKSAQKKPENKSAKKPVISPQFKQIKSTSKMQNNTKESVQKAQEKAKETIQNVEKKTQQTTQKAKETLNTGIDKTKNLAKETKTKLSDTTEKTKNWLQKMKDNTKEIFAKKENPKEINAQDLQKGGEINF